MKKLLFLIPALILSFPVFAKQPAAASVKTGDIAADFSLPDSSGKTVKLSDAFDKIVMLHFWSARCPFVKRYEERLKAITQDYAGKGVVVLGIDSNTGESLEQIREVAAKRGVNYPILIDEGNKIADQFGAVTTPHIFILDKERKLIYSGAVDDQSWSEKSQPHIAYVREALDAAIAGKTVPRPQTKTIGCTVKRQANA